MSEEVKKESFFSKYKNDSRYKAKVQLFGGFIFILFLVVWINISSMGSSGYMNEIVNEVKDDNDNKNNITLINEIKNNNYSFEIEVSKTIENNIDKIVYSGSLYTNNKLVKKIYNETNEEYYISNNNYYKKNNDIYFLINSSDYYSFINETFIDLNSIINYINNAKLESTTNYEDGRIQKSYTIKLSEIVMNNSGDTISILVEEHNSDNSSIIFTIDYTNLYNFYINDKLNNLTVKYTINNFNKVEKIEQPKIIN